MANELIPVSDLGNSKYGGDDNFALVAASSSFLPRLQLYGSNSEVVKEGKFPMGHYGLVRSKDLIEDLTGEVSVLVLGWRPKAMQIETEDITTLYNPESSNFKEICTKSEEPNSGCMYGPEYLVYIPKVKAFATFFMSSKTARREAPAVKALMGKMATLKAHLIKGKKFSWHGPQVLSCAMSPDECDDENFIAEVKDQVEKFRNPPETEKEKAPTGDGAATRDR
jgi:hypothetical protein